METVLKAISDWIKSLLTAAIMSNLSGLFDDVNTQVGNIAQQVGTKPSNFEPRVFAMIEALSRNVVLPIAGVILTFIACYELIEMITQHNNMAQFEPALLMKWIFKTSISVWMISNTFDIIMAVFDVTQQVVANSSGIISGNTRVNDIGLSMLQSSMMQMDVGPLFGLFLQSFFIGITMRILSIVIFVIVYGRMIEIYMMVSLAPVPMATWGNHEQSHVGQNYLRSLFALGFQGFLILICVAIYAVLLQNVAISGDINEQEAEIVRLIFDKYVYEGYGAQRIATYLNNAGYRARSGKCWHPGSLRGMVGNLTYMGVLRCGDARSELMPELQIIPQEEFEAAQRIREDRSAHAAEEAEHHVPLRTRGQALLSNNVYCGHCGARLALTTSRKWRKLSDGTLDDTLRIRYTCYGKLRKQTDCTGQTGYTMHILDEIIDKMVRQIFSRLRGIPKEQLITSRYAKETAERKNHLQALQAERDKAEKDLLALKTEILAVIKGESAFPKDTLAEMIAAQEKKHTELDTLCEEASAELERNAELMANVSQLYEELISYADLYDSASFEAKKMIVSQLIRRVEVYRGYQIHVDFNFDLAQYLENSDELAC